MTANQKPPRHKPLHHRPRAIALANFRKFDAAFHPRKSFSARGYDADWQELRQRHLKCEPWCVRCLAMGKRTLGKIVDHIKTVKEHPELRLDPENLQTLCHPCHNLKTNRVDGGFGNRKAR